MNDARTALRSLLIYALCVPLAIFLGYLLASPLDYQSLAVYGVLALTISAPLLLGYHYPFMLLAWNMGAVVFFLPGRLGLWFVAICISFAISFTHRILDKQVRFLSVPELTRPLLALAVVVIATAQLRGGIGLKAFGGESFGGRHYYFLLVDILGYFALTTRHIPLHRANLYTGLFLLSPVFGIIGDLYGKLPGNFDFIFLFIPPTAGSLGGEGIISRFSGVAAASGAACAYMLARHGVRNLLSSGHVARFALFCLFAFVMMMGGFRSMLIALLLVFAFQFWLEGMFKTKWVLTFGLGVVLLCAAAAPFTTKLPLPIQRTLAFLPFKVDLQAKLDAQGSTEWRLQMWRVAVPQVPQYLLLGKGYSISRRDFEMMTDQSFAVYNPEDRGSFIAGDYHNGPLSIIIPFGIWGVIAYLWFLIAGFRALIRNHRHGDPGLRTINAYLLAAFATRVFISLFIVGGFSTDMLALTGFLGLSVALNGGVASPGKRPGTAVPEETDKPEVRRVPRRLGVA